MEIREVVILSVIIALLLPAASSATPHAAYAGFAEPLQYYSLSPRDLSFATGVEQKTLSVSASDDAVYRYAYTSRDGRTWTHVVLSGNSLGDRWLNGSVSGQLSVTAANFNLTQQRLSTQRNFMVVYTCSHSGDAWDCHGGWQILQFNASLAQQDPCIGMQCDDDDHCTVDSCSGDACSHQDVGCASSDGCCPSGCTYPGDSDCPSCTPSCTGKQCGSDGCGGTCPPGCSGTQTCNSAGQCVTVPVGEADYYVATTGSDSNPGTISQPFKTVNKAISLATAGDLIYVRGGTYYQTVSAGRSGTASAPITISGYPGEQAIIDGQFTSPSGPYDPLFHITGNYVVVKDLTVQRSYGMGMLLSGTHDTASNIKSYRNMENGILVSGDYGLVENSDIGYNCLSNENFARTRHYWSTGLSAARHPSHVTLRNNTVHDTWGEGMSTFEAEDILMEDNTVYDNQVNVYISDTKYAVLRRNLIYSTPGNPIQPHYEQTGIMIGDELYNPASSDNVIVNNIVIGNKHNLYFWEGNEGGGLVNVLIAHNTFVNSVDGGNVQFLDGTHSGSRFENNIILQEGSLTIANFYGSTSGLTFSNNLWSKAPPSAITGTGNIVANPKIDKTGPVSPGQVYAWWFKVASDSPAIGKGKASEITEDFFKSHRDSQPDIGAYEKT